MKKYKLAKKALTMAVFAAAAFFPVSGYADDQDSKEPCIEKCADGICEPCPASSSAQ